MTRSSKGRGKLSRPAVIALLLLPPAALCLGALWQGPPVPTTSTPTPPVATPSLTSALGDAAGALRRGDCTAAYAAVAEAGREVESDAATLALVDGLYAHVCDDPGRAEVRLVEAAGGAGDLEDWRLLTLAESAADRGHRRLAGNALDRLLRDHGDSPLQASALVRAARLAWDDGNGDADRALALVERGRDVVAGSELDELAWEIGTARGDRAARETAARQLLTHHPVRAEELGVADLFRAPAPVGTAGEVDWAAVLAPDELLRRAERLLAADRPDGAVTALTAVPAGHRRFDWRLLSAQALTDQGEGLAALRLLAGATATTPVEAARLDWRRALAAFDAARVRRGRTPLPADERLRLRDEALHRLAAVGSQGDDRRLAVYALRRLFRELWDDDRVDEALAALERLREIDPQDLYGARALWQAGWEEFTARNASGAVGYWSELVSLYPESAYARNARYWTGRAHEELGHRQRAREIYAEIAAADTGDFYTRYARARLAGRAEPEPPLSALPPSAGGSAPLAEDRGIPWPEHPDFARARRLTDLGLDALARSELVAVRGDDGGTARDRAGDALESLILARLGDRRSSIGRIHDAFPVLGGPHQATAPARALRLYYPVAHGDVIRRQAEARGLPPHLVLGMVRQESGFDTEAVSRAGARGLMQLMPATSREVARDLGLPWSPNRLTDPAFNVALGTAYFRDVLEMFDGDVELALAGYNGGPYRIKRLWRNAGSERDVFLEGLPVAESRLYLKRILLLADSYRQLYPDSDPGPDGDRG